jgi:predicted transcriptional regulator
MSTSDKTGHDRQTILQPTADIVSAYAGNAKLSPAELVAAIGSVSTALGALGQTPAAPTTSVFPPAVPIKKSVTADFLICLEDGKKLKMLKRHLRTAYGMTFAEYRVKWGLPHDYPSVAPNYAARRSTLAKSIGLGNRKPVGRPRKTAAK